jgi:hypothetical protein
VATKRNPFINIAHGHDLAEAIDPGASSRPRPGLPRSRREPLVLSNFRSDATKNGPSLAGEPQGYLDHAYRIAMSYKEVIP